MTQGTCSVDGCEKPRKYRTPADWCNTHYQRWRRWGDPLVTVNDFSETLAQRLDHRTDKTGECWVWTGSRHAFGYGELSFHQRKYPAHRLAYELAYGPIPDGMSVLHQCDNPPCVRPDHLVAGSHARNMREKVARGRQPRGEAINTAKLTPAAVKAIRQSIGVSESELGRRYGVSQVAIHNVIQRKTWKHIA